MALIDIKFGTPVRVLTFNMLLTLLFCALYGHFSGEIDHVVDPRPEMNGHTRPYGEVVTYEQNCSEFNFGLMSITNTVSALTPSKWLYRISTCLLAPYLLIILPLALRQMFTEREFVESNRLSPTAVHRLARIASICQCIGFSSVLGIVYFYDIYHNDDEGVKIGVIEAPVPKWHNFTHAACYTGMVIFYTLEGIATTTLFLNCRNGKLLRRHGAWWKIFMVVFFCSCGLISMYFAARDATECRDYLLAAFCVTEYIFVYGTIYLQGSYGMYYAKKRLVVKLVGEDGGVVGCGEEKSVLVNSGKKIPIIVLDGCSESDRLDLPGTRSSTISGYYSDV